MLERSLFQPNVIYRLGRQLGRGGQFVVRLVENHPGLAAATPNDPTHSVAPDTLRMLIHCGIEINNPDALFPVDATASGGFVMPLVDRPVTLAEHLDVRHATLALGPRLDLAMRVLALVESLKRQRQCDLQHTDLKPENFLLDPAGRLCLSDLAGSLALCQVILPSDPSRVVARVGGSHGTPGYCRTAGTPDPAFALAVTLYQVVFGVHPCELLGFADPTLFQQHIENSLFVCCLKDPVASLGGVGRVPAPPFSEPVPMEVMLLFRETLLATRPAQPDEWQAALSDWRTRATSPAKVQTARARRFHWPTLPALPFQRRRLAHWAVLALLVLGVPLTGNAVVHTWRTWGSAAPLPPDPEVRPIFNRDGAVLLEAFRDDPSSP